MNDLIGVTINNYEIQQKLGAGGMGIVFRARHPVLELDVAIKVMRSELAGQEGFYDRFVREAQTIARLQHPGIVGVTNFGQHDGVTYLMMDFISGPTLRALVRDSPFGLPLESGVRIAVEMAQALDYAHSKGVLHLDLKPDNILMDPDPAPAGSAPGDCPYRPVISDFGLARLRVAPGISIHTTQRIGTPHYMSPEQCRGESLDDRSDLYSLGVMVYELLTGRRPFPVSTMVQAIHYHCTQIPEPPSSRLSSLPPSVDDLVLQMLAKRREQRPASGAEVAEQLEDLMIVSTPAVREGVVPDRDASVVTPTGVAMWSAERAPVYIQVMYQGNQIDRFPMSSDAILAGRLPTCELRLEADDRLVSKRHCEIRRQDGEMLIRDLHSTNKTYLDDVELVPDVPTPWPAGASVRLGFFALRWALSQTGKLPSVPAEREEEPTLPGDAPRIKCENANPRVLGLTHGPATIGRFPSCDMVIADPAVSKQHCEVRWDGSQVQVEDLHSTNGTFLADAQLEPGRPYPWPLGTDLRIGPHTIRFD